MSDELGRDADRARRAAGKTKFAYLQHRLRLARLRNGDVGGGRLPHRTRGKPPPRRTPAST